MSMRATKETEASRTSSAPREQRNVRRSLHATVGDHNISVYRRPVASGHSGAVRRSPWSRCGRCQVIERLSRFDLPDTILADERVLVSASYRMPGPRARSDESPSRRSRRVIALHVDLEARHDVVGGTEAYAVTLPAAADSAGHEVIDCRRASRDSAQCHPTRTRLWRTTQSRL